VEGVDLKAAARAKERVTEAMLERMAFVIRRGAVAAFKREGKE